MKFINTFISMLYNIYYYIFPKNKYNEPYAPRDSNKQFYPEFNEESPINLNYHKNINDKMYIDPTILSIKPSSNILMFSIGINFGGVLCSNDYTFTPNKTTTIDVPYAIDSLKYLKKYNCNLYLISFSGLERAINNRNCIEPISYLFSKQFFVKKMQYKKYICNLIGCHFMIDNRVEVLDDIHKHNHKIITILFGEALFHPDHMCARNWQDVLYIINNTSYFDIDINPNVELNKITHIF